VRAVTVYHSAQHGDAASEPEMPSGQIPAVRRRRSILRVLFLVALIVLLVSVLLMKAYTSQGHGSDGLKESDAADDRVPAAVREGGPVLDPRGGTPHAHRPPADTIALTFDDGPDPTWTPKILAVLRKYDVQATFFMIGSQVARHPGLARQVAEDGNEIGAHTFTHPELADIAGWRRDLEYSQTQKALVYATGKSTSLLRPPYSSVPDAIDQDGWNTIQDASRRGYVTVLNDLDSRDWARPGVANIVKGSTPQGAGGAIVLMHDAGGDRAETVAALDLLIPRLQQRGFQFKTVSAALGGAVPGNQTVRGNDRWSGRALVWTVQAADGTWNLLWLTLIIVGVLTLARTFLMFFVALGHARRRRKRSWGPPVTGPVSIIVPAYNEAETIGAAVTSLAASAHHRTEVIVVDDASTDGTAEIVEALHLPNVRVVRVPPGGKASALNAGTALSRFDLVVMVDADTVVEPDSVHRLVQPFTDPSIGAVAGNVKVGNRRTLLGRWQHIEYVIGFNLDRRMYDAFGCIPTIPGALGAFRRAALRDVGGLSTETIAEDTDLTMAIHRAGWRVVFQDSARARTEAPSTVSQLWSQRYRWSYGTMQAMWKHRHAVVESGPSGRFGRRGLPFIVAFTVVLPLLAPFMDVVAAYSAIFLNRWETLLGWLAIMLVQTVTAILAFRLDHERLRPLWALPLQQFAYRQVMYLVLLQSTGTAFTGRLLHWQKLRRTGEVTMTTS
jgi:cellulose synthase/poly-beta-1,6-N-acetylglucosamine synthase-like glycosyltransferase/peptidoglycan/xylan/chitin deacetylase (PgdA/CDA1 family)